VVEARFKLTRLLPSASDHSATLPITDQRLLGLYNTKALPNKLRNVMMQNIETRQLDIVVQSNRDGKISKGRKGT